MLSRSCLFIAIWLLLPATNLYAQADAPKLVPITAQPLISSVAFSPDGKTLTTTSDRIIFFRDTTTLELKKTFIKNHSPRTLWAWSAKGKYLAIVSANNTIQICDGLTHKVLHTLQGTGEVTSLAFSADRKTLATGGRSGEVKFWNIGTGKSTQILKTNGKLIRSLQYGANGVLLVGLSTPQRTYLVYDSVKHIKLRTLTFPPDSRPTVGLSPDGKTIATAHQNQVVFQDSKTGKALDPLTKPPANQKRRPNRFTQGSVSALHYSPDGTKLAVVTSRPTRRLSGSIVVWDLKTRKAGARVSWRDHVHSVTFSPDGNKIAYVSGRSAYLWDLKTKKVHSLAESKRVASSIAITSDGQTLVTARDDGARVWDLKSGKLMQTLSGLSRFAKISPDGKLVAIVGDGQHVWGVTKKQMVWNHKPKTKRTYYRIAAFSPDSKVLAAITTGGVMTVRKASSGEVVKSKLGVGIASQGMAFSPDGKFLVTGGGMGQRSTVQVWDTQTWKMVRQWDPHRGYRLAIGFSPDGKIMATGGEFDGIVKLWETSTWKLLRSLKVKSSFARDVAFSPDGKLLAVLSWYTRSELSLWEIVTGKQVRIVDASNRHQHMIKAITWSPATGQVISAEDRGQIRCWDLKSTHPVVTIQILPGRKLDGPSSRWVAFTPEGQCSFPPNAKPFLYWEVGKKRFPMERYERTLHQPKTIARLLSKGKREHAQGGK